MKLLLLALDGLDPELVARWGDDLPHLTVLRREGIFSPIVSTIPPMTFPAWSTFLTGVNPGRHGIFDFTERLPGRLKLRFLNATRRRYPTFLKLISEQGFRVGSIGLPTTYPPEALSGYQISGFDTPLPSRADRSYLYPRSLADEIKANLGGYSFGNFNESRIGADWHSRVLRQLRAGIERKVRLVRFLEKRIPLDLLLLHVGETDTVGHHFWAFCDARSPRHLPTQDREVADAVRLIYHAADDLVGKVIQICNPDTTIVVSDHGMGGTSDRILYLNQFLAERGLLTFAKSRYPEVVGKLKSWGLRWVPYRYQQQIFKMMKGRIANEIESALRFGGIDWGRTLAYSEELNYYPAIYINRRQREPFGIVSEDRVAHVCDRIMQALLDWRDPADGGRIVRAVHRREEIYSGPETESAPDLILELNQPEGYSYALGRTLSAPERSAWRKLTPAEYLGCKGASMNGSHRAKGTFILHRADFDYTPPPDLSLADVAPLIFRIFRLNAPTWIEAERGLSLCADRSADPAGGEEFAAYTSEEEDSLRRQLTRLGYF
jgi:predicted AlkP superfamily phosphohydrolase/phosphomutase